MRPGLLVFAIATTASACLSGLAAAQSPPSTSISMPEWARGQEVRITLADAAPQTGKLIALSSTEVVLRQHGTDVHLSLTRVRRIVTTPRPRHRAVMSGLLIGAVGGIALIRCSDSECPPTYAWMPIAAGIGAGVGAGIGAIAGRPGPQRIVYESSPSPKIGVSPLFSPAGRGIALTFRW